MPKIQPRGNAKLRQIISEYGDNVFSIQDGMLLYKLCCFQIPGEKAFNVKRHVNRNKHQQANREISSDVTMHSFYEEMCDAFISANIPLNKLTNTKLHSFLEKYTHRHIPDESTLRKTYVKTIYDKCINDIRNELKNEKLWVSIDETTDSIGRHIATVLVGAMKTESPGVPYLLTCEVLD